MHRILSLFKWKLEVKAMGVVSTISLHSLKEFGLRDPHSLAEPRATHHVFTLFTTVPSDGTDGCLSDSQSGQGLIELVALTLMHEKTCFRADFFLQMPW